MDPHQLRCFVSVARHNGFRRGAADLHIAQPAVSRHIRRLEAEIGQELFYRLSRGVALPEAGEVLLQHSEELFDRISDLHEELASLAERVSGTVRVGVSGRASCRERVCQYVYISVVAVSLKKKKKIKKKA